jgi:aminopeptidase YwaD
MLVTSAGCAGRLRARGPSAAGPEITEASVRSHMEFLASDALNGRGSGTRDEWIAASYLAAQMRKWGLEPLGDGGGFVKTVDLESDAVAAPPVLMVGEARFTHGKEMIATALIGARSSGRLKSYAPGTDVGPQDAVLLPEIDQAIAAATSRAALTLIKASAANLKNWNQIAGRPVSLPVRIIGAPAPPRPARVLLDAAAYAALERAAAGTAVSLDVQVKPGAKSQTWNAMGRLPGRDPILAKDVILLTAHLDHLGSRPPGPNATGDVIYNGADDDASGCVAVLELMEALATGKRPKRTLVFTWFGSEESGGHGARLFIDQPPAPLDTIVANLEFEMIGRPDGAVAPRTLWLTGYERTTLGPELARRGARLVADPHPEQNFFSRSDNIVLALRGVIAQTVSSYGLHKEYHSPSDDLQHIDFAHMTTAIRSMLGPVRWLANSDFRPQWLPGKKP